MSDFGEARRLDLPLDREAVCELRAGDACLLSGPMFTLRDAGHIRLLAELDDARASGATAEPDDARVAGTSAEPDDARAAGATAELDDARASGAPSARAAGAPSARAEGAPGAPNAPVAADELPYGLDGQAIFYAGPTPSAAGRPFGAIGPTTASRMDFAAPRLYDAGVVATIGKGTRSEAVVQACIRDKAVYFVTVGGAAAYLAKCVESSETLAYDDLGTEALRRVVVSDFPVFVGIDTLGNDVYDLS